MEYGYVEDGQWRPLAPSQVQEARESGLEVKTRADYEKESGKTEPAGTGDPRGNQYVLSTWSTEPGQSDLREIAKKFGVDISNVSPDMAIDLIKDAMYTKKLQEDMEKPDPTKNPPGFQAYNLGDRTEIWGYQPDPYSKTMVPSLIASRPITKTGGSDNGPAWANVDLARRRLEWEQGEKFAWDKEQALKALQQQAEQADLTRQNAWKQAQLQTRGQLANTYGRLGEYESQWAANPAQLSGAYPHLFGLGPGGWLESVIRARGGNYDPSIYQSPVVQIPDPWQRAQAAIPMEG